MINTEEVIIWNNLFGIDNVIKPGIIYGSINGGVESPSGLFDGNTANEWIGPTIHYFNIASCYIDFEIPEKCSIYRSGTSGWPQHNYKLKIEKYIGNNLVIQPIEQIMTETSDLKITKWINEIGPGRYKFSYGEGLRLDSEWYLVEINEPGFEQLIEAEEGYIRKTFLDNGFNRIGEWKEETNILNVDGIKNYTSSINSSVNFKFVGTDIKILSEGNKGGCQVEITIDGVTDIIDTFKKNFKNQRAVIFSKKGLSNECHNVEIRTITDGIFVFECIDINKSGYLIPLLSRDYEFPIKIGNEEDVKDYSNSLIGGEEQLLITREGKLYLTDGNGDYINAGGTDANSHIHDNAAQLNKIGESVNMLTYNGKIVVNNNEYSFRSLPRAKIIENYSTTKGGKLPWLL